MDNLISRFSEQLERAIQIGEATEIRKSAFPINNILITGLGGSGIGGTIISEWLKDKCAIPVVINKGYHIPEFVNENTLVIVSSYSGNTEETYNALQQAFKKDAKIISITSGGKVQEFSENNGLDYILIDGGMPPRACFGYSFVQQLYILNYLELADNSFKEDLKNAISLIDENKEDIQKEAKEKAEALYKTIPIIYSDETFEGVAVRFRQQINENSKMLCWHHVIPEMNHNELVGWRNEDEKLAVVFLRNDSDFPRNQQRMEFSRKVVDKYSGKSMEIHSKGNSKIEKIIYLIHLTDWISYYLSELNNKDAIEIEVINALKGQLASTPF